MIHCREFLARKPSPRASARHNISINTVFNFLLFIFLLPETQSYLVLFSTYHRILYSHGIKAGKTRNTTPERQQCAFSSRSNGDATTSLGPSDLAAIGADAQ
jgi:hypothetical protein